MGTPAPDSVKRLVDRFDQDRKVFLGSDYKEEQLRAEFLNPFFTTLGWDMDNKQGLSEFSVIANSVHSSWFTVPRTENRKPGTENQEPMKSSGSLPAIRPRSKKSPKSGKPAASITRRPATRSDLR